MQAPFVYELRKPDTVNPDQSYPALFVMHGIGSNEKDLLALVNGLEESLYIFSIRGPLPHPPGYSFFTIEGFGKPHREVFDETVQSLTDFIDYACEEYPIKQNELYFLGFSQGAILSMTLGLTLGNRVKGIVALSGYLPAFVKEEYSKKSVDQVSLFISHGETDPIFPLAWGENNRDFFQQLGANVTYKQYPEGHVVTQENYHDFRNWIEEQLEK